MRAAQHILALIALVACHGDDSGASDSAQDSERCAFSFVILTDTHIGEGVEDHGTAGWDDEQGGGIESDSEAILARAVADTNALAAAADGPSFALVLGDLSDSGERSELQRAHELLEALQIPWLPLLGNHEMWPYAYDTEQGAYAEADGPVGDGVMLDVFAPAFKQGAADLPSLVRAPAVWNPEIDAESSFVNFAFSHCGVRFVALDFTTRMHAGSGYPGVASEAVLHDFEGGSWPWVLADLAEGPGAEAETVVVLAHHPITNSALVSLDSSSFEMASDTLTQLGLDQRIAAFFGGHLHIDSEQQGPAGIPAVLTAATKEGTPPRVVHVSAQGELDWTVED